MDENERYFLNGGGMGFDSAINFYASKSRFAGFASYGIGLVKAVFRDFRQEQALITAPGFAFNEPVLFVAFLNGKREGGGFILAPDFDIQDGLLNVCIVGRGSSLPKLLPLIPRFQENWITLKLLQSKHHVWKSTSKDKGLLVRSMENVYSPKRQIWLRRLPPKK